MEEYSSCHPETIQELLDWDATLFEAAWKAHKLRQMIEKLECDQRSVIGGLYANSNIEDLQKAITSVNDNFNQIREDLLAGTRDVDDEENQQFITTPWWEKKPNGR